MISIRAALAGCLIALAVVGAFMALDRAYLHWYAEDTPGRVSALDGRIAALEAELSDNSSKDATTSEALTKISIDFTSLRDAVTAKLHCIIGNPPNGGPTITCP